MIFEDTHVPTINTTPLSLELLTPGSVIRRSLLHESFGGQTQGGVSTPSRHPIVMLFTGATGGQHGYDDGWSEGVFCYFGEGQIGDMPWTKGNTAIRDHGARGKNLYLFEILKKPRSYVRFMGQFDAASWEYRTAPDRKAHPRQAIVFHLLPVVPGYAEQGAWPSTSDRNVLRRAAWNAGATAPAKTVEKAKQSYFERSMLVRDYALSRADGSCEACSSNAPFVTKLGRPFLEVHHIRRLADGGPDTPDAVAAICPNCHRAAHFGSMAKELNDRLLSAIRQKEDLASAEND